MSQTRDRVPDEPEPRWPAVIAVIAVGGFYLSLPQVLSAGPRWLLLAVVCVLEIPTILAHRRGQHRLNQILGYSVSAAVTMALIWSLFLLVIAVPRKTLPPQELLRSAAILWCTNILVFASWYWRLDAGGPHARELRNEHTEGAFLFPQMTIHRSGGERDKWSPGFVDYLFLAFNSSVAFSPTDAPVLSRWAKVLMMIQALISLTIIAFLIARAVNIL